MRVCFTNCVSIDVFVLSMFNLLIMWPSNSYLYFFVLAL